MFEHEGGHALLIGGVTLWALAGFAVAWALAARGHTFPAAALIAWPFLLPALGAARDTIDEAVDGLVAALAAAGAEDLCDPAALRAALRAGERRVGELARLQAESEGLGEPGLRDEVGAAAQAARDELAAVLLAIRRLRVQVGLAGLTGARTLGDALVALNARASALGEVRRVATGRGLSP